MKRYVALVGFMASGKTTIGRGLARRLGCAFVDTDELIVREHGSIAAIFRKEGEAAFRRYETQALHAAFAGDGGVVALGGGALWSDEHRALVAGRAHCILINVSAERARSRLHASRHVRPLLGRAPSLADVTALYERRLAHYAGADFVVEAERMSGAQAVEEIVGWLRAKGIDIGSA